MSRNPIFDLAILMRELECTPIRKVGRLKYLGAQMRASDVAAGINGLNAAREVFAEEEHAV